MGSIQARTLLIFPKYQNVLGAPNQITKLPGSRL